MTAEHTFSHIHWTMRVLIAHEEPETLALLAAESGVPYATAVPEAAGMDENFEEADTQDEENAEEWRWISREDMQTIAFPNLFLNILNRYFDGERE